MSPNNLNKLTELLTQKEDVIRQQCAEIENLKLRYQHILEQFRLAQHQQFGKSSEVSVDQLALFNEAEQIAEIDTIETATPKTIHYTRQQP